MRFSSFAFRVAISRITIRISNTVHAATSSTPNSELPPIFTDAPVNSISGVLLPSGSTPSEAITTGKASASAVRCQPSASV